ncbi:hypothetical protein HYU40_03350 [Candidatus Woesearchaeota archaeon]|nr:hypothetical protein [Candidatus Woesearchaeota archaeon]
MEEIIKAAKLSIDKKLQDRIIAWGLNPNDREISGLFTEMRKFIEYETLLESTLPRIRTKDVLKEAMEKSENIRHNLQFLVTCAYMKKQDKVNVNILRLNRFIVFLTIIVILIMLLQNPINYLALGLLIALMLLFIIYKS